jgi:hypothetical protein
MPWRAFQLGSTELTLIEWLRRPNPNNPSHLRNIKFSDIPTFSQRPSGVSFASEFGLEAPGLDNLYANLVRQGRASSFPSVAVHSALMLSQLTQKHVLSVCSDDDDWDFVCEVRANQVHYITFISQGTEAAQEITFKQGCEVKFQPLLLDTPRILHHVAEREVTLWSRDLRPLFGFDGDARLLTIVEIDHSRSC